MILELRGSHVALAASGADVGAFFCVAPPVGLESAVMNEALGAELTHERLLSHVVLVADMGIEVGRGTVPFVAALVGALVFVCILTSVYLQMSLEMFLLSECVRTLFALERLLSSMDSHVDLEFALPREDLVAMYAGPVPDLLLCGGPMLRLYDLIDGGLDLTFDIEFLPIDLGPQSEKEGLGAFPFGGAGGIILVLMSDN